MPEAKKVGGNPEKPVVMSGTRPRAGVIRHRMSFVLVISTVASFLESPRCGAKTRKNTPCQSPAMPNGRCRMHGGKSPGAPTGNRNAWKTRSLLGRG